ncbi:MAG: hypothetical protein MUP17_04925 [candidate division Zixibacteria bacterium]|nr:hypothetical protein [candidate division Zixibacteria bacterium]
MITEEDKKTIEEWKRKNERIDKLNKNRWIALIILGVIDLGILPIMTHFYPGTFFMAVIIISVLLITMTIFNLMIGWKINKIIRGNLTKKQFKEEMDQFEKKEIGRNANY